MADPEAAAAPAKKKSKLMLILVPVVLANMGGLGYMFLRNKGEPAAGGETGGTEGAHGAAGKGPAKAGPVVPLDAFVVNLHEVDVKSYLKLRIDVELADDKVKDEFELAKFAIRDAVLRYLSGLKLADTQGEAGNAKIRNAVLALMTKELGAKKIKRLFISELVVQ